MSNSCFSNKRRSVVPTGSGKVAVLAKSGSGKVMFLAALASDEVGPPVAGFSGTSH